MYADVSVFCFFFLLWRERALGRVQHYNSCYYDWLTAASLPKLQALTQSSAAEVMPGSPARNPHSQQGYEIRSKFRGLLSRPRYNSINQTGRPRRLLFYKRGFSAFYCHASWITSWAKSSVMSRLKCPT